MDRDEMLARIARRRASIERANNEDRERFQALSMDERGRLLAQACAAAMAAIASRNDPEEIARLLWESEPPHPSYLELKRRLKTRKP